MEIEVTPLETFDESIYAGYRHAYQIKDVDGSCCRSEIWDGLIAPCCSDLGRKEEVMMDEQMDMEPERTFFFKKSNLIVVSEMCLEIRQKERKSHPEISHLLS